MACVNINDVESTFTTADEEWHCLFIKAREWLDRILVNVLLISVVDSSDNLPVVNNEEVLLTTIEAHLVFCILAEALNSFNLKVD